MASFIVMSTGAIADGALRVQLQVTLINRAKSDKRIVLSDPGGEIEISIPLAEVDALLASIIEERNKGLAL